MNTDNDRGGIDDRWRRVESLYHEMLARPVQQRAAALAAACSGDPALVAEVQSLLDQPKSAAGFLASPAMNVAAKIVPPAGSSLLGRRIGAFEVQELLGVLVGWARCTARGTRGWEQAVAIKRAAHVQGR